MKQIDVALWELTKEEAKTLTEEQQMLVFNPLMGTYSVERGGKKSLPNNKYVISQLKYFSFEELKQKKAYVPPIVNIEMLKAYNASLKENLI